MAIQQLRLCTAPGKDGIPNAFLIKCSAMLPPLTSLYELCRTLETAAPSLGRMAARFLCTKKMTQAFHKTATVLNSVGNLYARVLNNWLTPYVDPCLAEEQAGLQDGRRCEDQLFTLTDIIEKKIQ